jgi:hypothetical protein
MANHKGRPPRSTEVMVLPWRMTDMLSRTRFDMSRALKGEHWEALKTAAERCVRCAAQTRCEQWIAQHQQGEGNPVPSFCPNAHFIRSNRPCALPPMQGAKAAQKLLEAAPFDPATIKVLLRALEDAWLRLGTTTEPETLDDTWLSLAHAIVAHTVTGGIDGETLTVAAIAAVQKHPLQGRTQTAPSSEKPSLCDDDEC